MAVGEQMVRRFVLLHKDELAESTRLARRDCRSWSGYVRNLIVLDIERHGGQNWRERQAKP
jgi:hypothetical protein